MYHLRRNFLILLVFTLGMIQCHSGYAESKKDKKHSHGSKKKEHCHPHCKKVTLIKKVPFVIKSPGYYKLACDLEFNPKMSRYAPPDPRAVQAAITIKSSNVHLELDHHTLTQKVPFDPSAQVPFCIGILVPDPLSTSSEPNAIGWHSIYITGHEGVIDGFSMYGVRIFAHTSDIQLENFTITNCGALASKAFRPVVYGQPYLPHDQAVGSAFGPSFGVAGLSIGESVGLGEGPTFFSDVPTNQLNIVNRTQNVILKNINCIHNFALGAWIKVTNNLTIENSHFDNTWSDEPGSATPAFGAIPAWGLMLEDAQLNVAPNGNTDPGNINVSVSNSTFNNSSLIGDYTTPLANLTTSIAAYGCVEARGKNIVFSNCQFNNASCTFPNAGAVQARTGGYVFNSSEDVSFTECSFDGGFNLGRVIGVLIDGTSRNEPVKSARNIRFINCTANNLQDRVDLILPAPLLNTTTVQSYNLNFIKDLYMENCQANDLLASGPTPSTGSTNGGFAPASGSSVPTAQVENWVFRNCISQRIRSIDGGTSWGFNGFVPSPTLGNSLIFENCISTGHQVTLASVYPAWSATTTYSVGALVSFAVVNAVVNYVSLTNSNLNFQPNQNPTQWSVINTAPLAWSVTTTYALGAQVSFTDSTGHTNEYISTIAGNVGNFPNAPGPGAGAITTNWVQTNLYPTWNSALTYQLNSIVGFQGILYRSLIAPNTGNNPTSSPTAWSSTTNIVQLTAGGFNSQQNQVNGVGGPEVYLNCVASQNKGAPGPVSQAGTSRYSSGFSTIAAFGTLYDSCKALDNNYGFMLINSNRCVVINSEAFNNGVAGVGEGFTDVGTGSVTTPTISTTMWENNSAYNNGTGLIHEGTNGNYNILLGSGVTPLILNCSNATSNCFLTPASQPSYFGGKHNKSTVQ